VGGMVSEHTKMRVDTTIFKMFLPTDW